MARVKWHNTSEGPKRCRASSPATCHYGQQEHFQKKDDAQRAFDHNEEVKKRKLNEKRETERLNEVLMRGPDARLFHDISIRDNSARKFAEEMEQKEARGEKPELVGGVISTVIEGPKGKSTFTASKNYKAYGSPPSIVPRYRMTLQDEKDQVVYDEDHPVYGPDDGQIIQREAHRIISDGATRAYYAEPDGEAFKKRDELVDSFLNGMKTIENEERGGDGAAKIGLGYFRADKESVNVEIDYCETAYRTKHLQDQLDSSEYDDHTPQVTIVAQDSNAKNSKAFWTMTYDSNEADVYHLHVTNADGSKKSYTYQSPEEVDGHVSKFSQSEMGLGESEAQTRGNFAGRTLTETRDAVAQHRSRAQRNAAEREQQDRQSNVRRQHQDLYEDDDAEDNKPFGKLFNLFS